MSLTDFRNEPFTDFSNPQNAAAMRQALADVKAQLGRTYPLIIDGEQINTEATIASINPARPSQVVGYAASGRFQARSHQRCSDTVVRRGSRCAVGPGDRRSRAAENRGPHAGGHGCRWARA